MEKLNFKLEFADNGVIVTDDSSGSVNVYQEKEDGSYREYTKRAISESVDNIIAHLLLDGTENLKQKSIYKIKIEIR
ncbi:hypothetical protein DW657_13740 [Prevotella sp. AM23-5]|jgi:hypothetical protein|uniref:hypothetical protein n=1 Tax=Prevotellaceae TaxID=171552 RepID=UPI000E48A71F|nr:MULTISPECIES: hypothetical protein [Prevotellaceae]RHN89247.1 hypothetical protein DW657_13740 [Prevotella sp. AM23-5]